jgi:hypothetical protein
VYLNCEVRLLRKTQFFTATEQKFIYCCYGMMVYSSGVTYSVRRGKILLGVFIPKSYFYRLYFYLLALYEHVYWFSLNFHLKNFLIFWLSSGWQPLLFTAHFQTSYFYFNVRVCVYRLGSCII